MSVKEFKAELNGLGAKISASRIQKLTHLAIKLSLKYADQIVGILAEYIQESSFSTRLGALSVIDSICRGAAKLHEKDSKWENVYFKLIPGRLGPVIHILFDCSSKDKERMKRIVGLWKENAKLLPFEFADSIYSNNFKEVDGVVQEESPQTAVASSKTETTEMPNSNVADNAYNSPAKLLNDNSALIQNLSPVDPSAIAGLSALLNLPSLGGLSLPILTTTVNGSLGLTGLATANASSSILDGLSALKGQNISIGLPGATPANIAPLLESENEQKNSNSSTDMRQSHSRQNDSYEGSNDHLDSRHRHHYDSSSRHQNQSYSNDPRQSYSNDPRQSYSNDPRQSYSNDPRQSYSNDPRQSYSIDPRQQHDHRQQQQSHGGDPRQHQQSYGNDPRQQQGRDPRQQHGSDPRQQQQSYGSDPRQQNHSDPRQQHQSRSNDSRQQFREDSRRGEGHDSNPRSNFQDRNASQRDHGAESTSRYPSNHSGNDESQHRLKKVPPPQLAPGPDCAPSFIDPSVLKDHIKIISRTLFISGVPSSYSQADFKDMIEQVGRVESLRITQKQQAFIKVATRMEAEAIKHAYQGFKGDQGGPLKIGWGCGYGPKEGFDFQEGTTLYEISRIPEQEIPYIEQSPRGGGLVKGGMAMEEPNVPLDLTMAGRGLGGKRPNSTQNQGDFPTKQRW